MAGRGVYFALTEEQDRALRTAPGYDEVMMVIEVLEERWDSTRLAECDKARHGFDSILSCATKTPTTTSDT